MFDDRSRKYKNQYVSLKSVDIEKYEPFVGKHMIDELKWISEPLRNKVWANINSTFVGGGVAEMLQSEVPLARSLGIDCRWFVIEGSDSFFSVTKKFHNMLQGIDQPITLQEIFHAYLDTIDENTRNVRVVGHMVVVHDPQPAAIIMNGNVYGHILWRCHIDTTNASRRIWRFLLPYINQYWGAIFTTEEFIRTPLQIPTYKISPSIDPLRVKNKQYSRKEALGNLSSLLDKNDIDPDRPIVLAVSRFDVHKNQKSIIKAFKLLKNEFKGKKRPQLVIVGNSATDDPEGQKMYEDIIYEAGEDKDIYIFLNVKDNDRVIGSLMTIADCFIHISTKEGFGLVVTEALWHGTPVIGSKVGGITKQIIHKHNGFLVEPYDYSGIAKSIKELIQDKDMRKELGKNAIEYVREHFLLPQMLYKELILMRYYLEIDNKIPPFRINDLTYREISQALYGRTVWPFSSDDLKKRIETIIEGFEASWD
ncbi:MAG: glycosyltransferase [Candidatus Omnitrophica bacterium]|nr:glycosyltransferase [Candidatus Omnitrophota bacterium]